MPLERMVVPAAVELGIGPLMSKVINSDFLEGDTGTVGLEEEPEAPGIENPTTDDVGRVLRVAEAEDADAWDEEAEEDGGRKSPAHDFLTVVGAEGGAAETVGAECTAAGAVNVEVWTGVGSVVVARSCAGTEDPETTVELETVVDIGSVDNVTMEGGDDASGSNSVTTPSSISSSTFV